MTPSRACCAVVSDTSSAYPWLCAVLLEKEMVTHASILAWKMLRTEELGGLQSTGSQELDRTW